jgi:hypothetical protein
LAWIILVAFIVKGAVVVVIVLQLDFQLHEQSVLITTKVDGEVYSIQHYVIKFVSDLRQVGGFSGYSGFLHQYN